MFGSLRMPAGERRRISYTGERLFGKGKAQVVKKCTQINETEQFLICGVFYSTTMNFELG
jgi:hypothetical protein